MGNGKRGRASRRGVSLVAVCLLMVGLAVMSLALFTVVNSTTKAQRATREEVNARYVAEAGLSVAMLQLGQGADLAEVNAGSQQAPVAYGDASYWVEAVDLGNDLYTLTATGIENGVGSRLDLVVREATDTFYVWAAFGDEGLNMSSNVRTDSYNSSLGPYTDQDVNGSGSSSYALTNGHIGSNHNIHADSNVKVHGNATPGPSGTATFTDNAIVTGSTTPAADLVDLPPIVVPSVPSFGNASFKNSGTSPFGNNVPAGDYGFGSVTVDTTQLVIHGPATLVFDSLLIKSNAGITFDTTDGPIELYVLTDFTMDSNTFMKPDNDIPADLEIKLLSDNIIDPGQLVDFDHEIQFDSNAEVYGTIYAPNAKIKLDSNFELFGSLVARRLEIDSNTRIHFDEALLEANQDGEHNLELVAWRHTPYHP